jgi:hypothetical protein
VVFDLHECISQMYGLFDLPNSHAGMGHVCCATCNGLHQFCMNVDSREDELAGIKEINVGYNKQQRKL